MQTFIKVDGNKACTDGSDSSDTKLQQHNGVIIRDVASTKATSTSTENWLSSTTQVLVLAKAHYIVRHKSLIFNHMLKKGDPVLIFLWYEYSDTTSHQMIV